MLYARLLSTVFLFVHHVIGVNVPITNPSFETDAFPIPSNTYKYDKDWGGVTGWNYYDPNGVADTEYSAGCQNPSGGDAFTQSLSGCGIQIAYVEPKEDKAEGKGELGIEQTLTTTIEGYKIYTLSAYVGNIADNKWSGDSTEANDETKNRELGFPGSKVQLLDSSNVILAQDVIPIDGAGAEGTWTLSTAQVTIDPGHSSIGRNLKIRLININSQKDTGFEVTFDCVSLTAVSSTSAPTKRPTPNPTKVPTANPTRQPTSNPTKKPTTNPTKNPITTDPTKRPTLNPSKRPTQQPTESPTKRPTRDPSDSPTKSPTKQPTESPTHAPTPEPTANPTKSPTEYPTVSPSKGPTPAPTDSPTLAPSPSPTGLPTPTGTWNCGDTVSGPYVGEQVQFIVNLPFPEVELQFDGSQSTFNLQQIDAFLARGNPPLYFGREQPEGEGVNTLSNMPVGNYKFVMYGDNVAGGEYIVTIRCLSKSPTNAPTKAPSSGPTMSPTRSPSSGPTAPPSSNPTAPPTAAPTVPPTPPDSESVDENLVTTGYPLEIEICETECEFNEDDVTAAVVQTLSEFEVTVKSVQTVDLTVEMEIRVKWNQDKVLSDEDMEDELEEQLDPDYPGVDVKVIRDEDSDDQSEDGEAATVVIALVNELKYVLAGVAGLLMCCCSFGGIWFLRYYKSQQHILKMQVEQLNERQKVMPTTDAMNTDNQRGECGSGPSTNEPMYTNDFRPPPRNVKPSTDASDGLVENTGQSPYVFQSPNSPDSDGSNAAMYAPQPGMQRIESDQQLINNQMQNQMNQMNQMMNMMASHPPPGAAAPVPVVPAAVPPQQPDAQDNEDYEYYYDDETDEENDGEELFGDGGGGTVQ
eukprot:92780_1